MVPELLVLAVEFHRAPLRFGHLKDPSRPLPDGFGDWLAEAGAALSAGRIGATAAALGAPPEDLQEAFLFFVRQTLLLPQSDHYRVLGLARDCDADAIKRHHGLLVRLFHPDRMPGEDERRILLTARVNAAYQALRDPETRGRYDRQLPPLPAGDGTAAERLDFFRPRDPIKPFARVGRPAGRTPLRVRPLAIWGLGCAGVGVLLYLLTGEGDQPALRIGTQSAGGGTPVPAYLRQGEAQARLARSEPAPLPEPTLSPTPPSAAPAPPSPAASGDTALTAAAGTSRPSPADAADPPHLPGGSAAASAATPGDRAAAPAAAAKDPETASAAPRTEGLGPLLVAAAQPGRDPGDAAGGDRPPAPETFEIEAPAPVPQVGRTREPADPVRARTARETARPVPAPGAARAEATKPGEETAAADPPAPAQGAGGSSPGVTVATQRPAPAPRTSTKAPAGVGDAGRVERKRPVPPSAVEPESRAPGRPGAAPSAETRQRGARPTGKPGVAGTPPSERDPSPRAAAGAEGVGEAPRTRRPGPVAKASPPAPARPQARAGVPGEAAAARVITRLQRSYTNGDLGGLASLFTANAVVNEGAGLGFIRKRYSAIFARDHHRRIAIFDLHWRPGPQQKLLGTGEIRLRGRPSRAEAWRSSAGRIELELVPWRGEYRISKMVYRLSRG